MKLSTKGRYGLKAMFYLALNYDIKRPIPLKEIAENQRISESYLEQLLSKLRRVGLIKSVRGAQGGYLLARYPEEITVGSVLRVLEGDLSPSNCAVEGSNICDNVECVTKNVWIKIRDSIYKVVDNITLKDMVNDYNVNINKDLKIFE